MPNTHRNHPVPVAASGYPAPLIPGQQERRAAALDARNFRPVTAQPCNRDLRMFLDMEHIIYKLVRTGRVAPTPMAPGQRAVTFASPAGTNCRTILHTRSPLVVPLGAHSSDSGVDIGRTTGVAV